MVHFSKFHVQLEDKMPAVYVATFKHGLRARLLNNNLSRKLQ